MGNESHRPTGILLILCAVDTPTRIERGYHAAASSSPVSDDVARKGRGYDYVPMLYALIA
jgi:hypothetical protein